MIERISIGELSARSGVAVSAIRYYERIGLLSPVARVSGRRRYTTDAVASLSLIRLGQAAGFTLAELRALRMSGGEGPGDPGWAAVLGRKLDANSAAMERLRHAQRLLTAALGCGCSDLAACARRNAPP
jgi:MerR family redox-sensitive transcriptional activator SoxR